MTKSEAIRLRNIVEQATASLEDSVASEAVSLFPKLKRDGSLVKAGTRIRWNGALKRAAVDLWDTEENSPDIAPALWEDVLYRDGIRIIPEIITTGLAFSKGEIGWWNDVKYISKVDANVYNPEQYAGNWDIYQVG